MANDNFVELVRATVETLEDLLGGNEPNTQIYTEQCKAMVHGFVQVRNCLPTLLEGANGVCSAPIFKELYCLTSGALRILKLCCEEQKWLQAAILLKVHIGNGPKWSTFETLREELDWCINILRGNIDASTSTGIHVDRLTHRDIEILVEIDEGILRQKLRDTAGSGTSQEVSIANFLLARLDMSNGPPLDPNSTCIVEPNCWQPQYQETGPLIYLIDMEGPDQEAQTPRVFEDGKSVSINRTWFGIKVAEKPLRNGDNRKQWENEADIMATLSHPNVVCFIGCSDGEEPAIIMERADQSLEDYINALQDAEQPLRNLQTLAERRRRATPPLLDTVVAVDLLTQIASGMAYLHSQDIAHLDLKLANLLITSYTEYKFLHVKIADLGHSIRLKGVSGKIRNPLRKNHGTTVYRAMELFHGDEWVCFKAADVCSFAFTAWAILHCHEPRLEILRYDEEEEEEEPRVEIVNLTSPCYYDALVAGRRLGFDDTIPWELRALVKRCWDTNPDIRPPFSEIYWVLQSLKAKLLGSHVPLVSLQKRTAKPRSGIRLWPRMLCLGSRQEELDEQLEESV